MREINYDMPYLNSLDAVEMIDDISEVSFHKARYNEISGDLYTVKFSDGNELHCGDQFNFIRMINAYLRYLRNGDVVSVYDSNGEVNKNDI